MNTALPTTILLHNCRVVLLDRTAETSSLLIENGRIARIIHPDSNQSVQADSVIDLDGLTLFPGFVDVHIHGAKGVDTMEASADDLRRVSAFLARNGVTAWMPTLVPASDEQYELSIRAIDEAVAQTSVCESPTEV